MIQTLFGSTEETQPGLFERMKQAVTRTRENLAERIEEVLPLERKSTAIRSTILKPR